LLTSLVQTDSIANTSCCEVVGTALSQLVKKLATNLLQTHLVDKVVGTTQRKNVCACVGHKKDGEEFKCQIVNKNMAI
jgi:hypothetical protein